jgi:hypothetical protein
MRTDNRVTHPLHVGYLVVGLVFLGIAGSWALRTADLVDARGIGWLLPLMLVTAGAIGLVASTAKGRRRSRHTDESYIADLEGGDTYDPPLVDLAFDDLDLKLDRAARSGSTSVTAVDSRDNPDQTASNPASDPASIPGSNPASNPASKQGETT